MSTRRSASVGALPHERKHFVLRSGSSGSGGVSLDVRCACQYFGGETPSSSQGNRINVSTIGKREHQPTCIQYQGGKPNSTPALRQQEGEQLSSPASVDISFLERHPDLQKTSRTRGLVVRSISDAEDPLFQRCKRTRYDSADRMSNEGGGADGGGITTTTYDSVSMHRGISLRRVSRSPSQAKDLFVADLNIGGMSPTSKRQSPQKRRSVSASRRSSHVDFSRFASYQQVPQINLITPTPLPSTTVPYSSEKAPDFPATNIYKLSTTENKENIPHTDDIFTAEIESIESPTTTKLTLAIDINETIKRSTSQLNLITDTERDDENINPKVEEKMTTSTLPVAREIRKMSINVIDTILKRSHPPDEKDTSSSAIISKKPATETEVAEIDNIHSVPSISKLSDIQAPTDETAEIVLTEETQVPVKASYASRFKSMFSLKPTSNVSTTEERDLDQKKRGKSPAFSEISISRVEVSANVAIEVKTGSNAATSSKKANTETSKQVTETFSLKVDDMDQYMIKPSKPKSTSLSRSGTVTRSMSKEFVAGGSSALNIERQGISTSPIEIKDSFVPIIAPRGIVDPELWSSTNKVILPRRSSAVELPRSSSISRATSEHIYPESRGRPLYSAVIAIDSQGKKIVPPRSLSSSDRRADTLDDRQPIARGFSEQRVTLPMSNRQILDSRKDLSDLPSDSRKRLSFYVADPNAKIYPSTDQKTLTKATVCSENEGKVQSLTQDSQKPTKEEEPLKRTR